MAHRMISPLSDNQKQQKERRTGMKKGVVSVLSALAGAAVGAGALGYQKTKLHDQDFETAVTGIDLMHVMGIDKNDISAACGKYVVFNPDFTMAV